MQFERLVCYYLMKFGYQFVEGEPPCMVDMALNTLYYSTNPCYPAVEMVLKRRDGKVVGFQVTRGKTTFKDVKVSALGNLRDKLKCEPKDLELCLVLATKKSPKMKIKFGESTPSIVANITMIKPPETVACVTEAEDIKNTVICREWVLDSKYNYEPAEVEKAIGG